VRGARERLSIGSFPPLILGLLLPIAERVDDLPAVSAPMTFLALEGFVRLEDGLDLVLVRHGGSVRRRLRESPYAWTFRALVGHAAHVPHEP
jgi:hypothetical protein